MSRKVAVKKEASKKINKVRAKKPPVAVGGRVRGKKTKMTLYKEKDFNHFSACAD